jgi:hypothetical protein
MLDLYYTIFLHDFLSLSQQLEMTAVRRPFSGTYFFSLDGLVSLVGSHSELILKQSVLQTVCRAPWTGDQPVARPLPTQDNTNTEYGRAIAQAFSHCDGPGSIPGQVMWDLWWTKWHCGRFPLPIFIPLIAPQSPSYIIWGWYNRPIVAAIPSGLSLPPLNYKKNSVFF